MITTTKPRSTAPKKKLADLRPLARALLAKFDRGIEVGSGNQIQVDAHLSHHDFQRNYVLFSDVDPDTWHQESLFDHDRWHDLFIAAVKKAFTVKGERLPVLLPPLSSNRPCLEPVGTVLIAWHPQPQELEVYRMDEERLKRERKKKRDAVARTGAVKKDGLILVDKDGVGLGPRLRGARLLLRCQGMITDRESDAIKTRIGAFEKKYPEAFPATKRRAKKKRA